MHSPKHILVSSLTDVTDSAAVKKVYGDADESDHPDLILWNNFVILKPFATFLDNLKVKMRGIRFGYSSDNCAYATTSSIGKSFVGEFFVYVPGERYARGSVGFMNYRINKNHSFNIDEWEYMVRTPYIKNNKYHVSREQHNMLITSNPALALKKAAANLRAYTVDIVAKIESDTLRKGLRSSCNKVNSGWSEARDDLTRMQSFINELIGAYENGFRFVDPFLNDKLGKLKLATENLKEFNSKAAQFLFVQVRMVNGQQYVDMISVGFDKNDGYYYYSDAKVGETLTLQGEEVPQDIAAKIATLSILDKNTFVEGVGAKVYEDSYWVFRG